MSHIFISYSHKDSRYAHKLEDALKKRGFDVWIDDRIDYGKTWPQVIEEHVDSCAAFIVIMTPRSKGSSWVQNELARAQRKQKPIFPLLLKGECWLAVESIQYVDVRDNKLPAERFYDLFAQVEPRHMPTSEASAVLDPAIDESKPKLISDILEGGAERHKQWQSDGLEIPDTVAPVLRHLGRPQLSRKRMLLVGASLGAVFGIALLISSIFLPQLWRPRSTPAVPTPTNSEKPALATPIHAATTAAPTATVDSVNPTPTLESTVLCERASTYEVQDGDTLFSIARRFCVSVEALTKENDIEDPDRVFAGAELRIPLLEIADVTPAPLGEPTQSYRLVFVIDHRDIDGMVMVQVSSGMFQMGSSEGRPDERAVHLVALPRFWLDRTEVTNAQFGIFLNHPDHSRQEAEKPWMDMSQGQFIQDGDHFYLRDDSQRNRSVTGVTWFGARAYCEWAGARLPTEAEWEYAARGSSGRQYPWGDEAPDCTKANFHSCVGETTAVDAHESAFGWCGALDLGGNVLEWVNDFYDENYYAVAPVNDPIGPASGAERVLRGGFWDSPPEDLRASTRFHAVPDSSFPVGAVGFRCAMDPD